MELVLVGISGEHQYFGASLHFFRLPLALESYHFIYDFSKGKILLIWGLCMRFTCLLGHGRKHLERQRIINKFVENLTFSRGIK